ncbi:MAG: Fe-S cluster assembly protein SufD [Candidatus Omnitrophica bacterium]|nr:Fe-S cluster assembly protein SufD [Candidatus Omnitrophota bacterium]
MSNTSLQTTDFIENFSQLAQERISQEPVDWMKSLRKESLARFENAGIPTVKDEEWKYTNMSPIVKQKFSLAASADFSEQKAFDAYCANDPIRITFVNGRFDPGLSRLNKLPQGLTVLTMDQALQSHGEQIQRLLSLYETGESSSFTALNTALTDNGVYMEIDANAHVPEYVHIVHVTSGSKEDALALPRAIINAGKSSEATILESHIAFDQNITYFTNALTDIYLAENAVLDYTKTQHESLKAYHVNNTRVWQERNSNFYSITLMTGSALNRNNLDIILNGEGIESTLNGLYCNYGRQHIDNHTSVDHRFPNCVSNQLYKGILNDSARAVFNGKIFVQSIAQQTNSYQLNKNLLLGTDCRVDTKPQLEIFADDVRCTHGATIGQLDEDELFYLRTRCIGKADARKMLARGFVDDLLNHVRSEEINRKLHALLEPAFTLLK